MEQRIDKDNINTNPGASQPNPFRIKSMELDIGQILKCKLSEDDVDKFRQSLSRKSIMDCYSYSFGYEPELGDESLPEHPVHRFLEAMKYCLTQLEDEDLYSAFRLHSIVINDTKNDTNNDISARLQPYRCLPLVIDEALQRPELAQYLLGTRDAKIIRKVREYLTAEFKKNPYVLDKNGYKYPVLCGVRLPSFSTFADVAEILREKLEDVIDPPIQESDVIANINALQANKVQFLPVDDVMVIKTMHLAQHTAHFKILKGKLKESFGQKKLDILDKMQEVKATSKLLTCVVAKLKAMLAPVNDDQGQSSSLSISSINPAQARIEEAKEGEEKEPTVKHKKGLRVIAKPFYPGGK
jgi:hypothetical protein